MYKNKLLNKKTFLHIFLENIVIDLYLILESSPPSLPL